MQRKIKLTRREEDILHVLWDSDKVMSARDVANETDISMNTVQSVMRKLLKGGYIKTASIGYSGTVLTREYVANITEQDYYATLISKPALKALAAAFINKDAAGDDLDELSKLIETKKDED
ncbi:BlaI/MecI/CopY family transcriptional regulator [Lacticaseibacillus hulanensis]|jgi:predicted transcriptional regulator|uniref:BlaI/MecI/CopY family transcriptional regulator n=1 Tax=Lacticaseibacillus hulanensis TaxID=2493111 RepID=UPI000FDA40F1|nr:BlaI/MecI/CopY family transcriptional regulator [Lacticaseibacillus hulanensis]